MGKRGRAKARQAGGPQRPAQTPPSASLRPPQVHVTVATLPRADLVGSLEHDAKLVKAALLYADHVTLASPNAIMFAGVAGLTVPDSQTRRDALVAMASVLPDAKDPLAVYEDLRRRRKRLAPVERLALLRIEQTLKTSGDELADTTRTLLDQAGMPELQRAMEAGVLGIHMLDLENAAPDEFASVVIDGLARVLTEAVSSKARTYPLFDDGTGDLVGKMIAEGRIKDVRTARGAELGAAGRLIGRLEAFPDADMDVVLDVREQLEAPLIRFRAALARVSRDIEAAPWNSKEFTRETEELYQQHVAPALTELDQAMNELGARATLRRVAADAQTLNATAAIAISAAASVGLAHLPAVILGSGPLAGVISGGAAEAERRAQNRRQQEANEFYFLYEANRQLGS